MSRVRLWMVLGLVAAAYAGLPAAGLVWDDHPLVEHNQAVLAPTWDLVFGKDLWAGTGEGRTGYYRPLFTLTLALEHRLFGLAPAVAHAQNLLWHLVCVALVHALLVRRAGAAAAIAGSLVFGLHPLQSEAVVWVAARNDLLAAAGCLGALVAMDRGRPAWVALATLAACLSKENAFLLPLVAFAWRRAWGDGIPGREALGMGLALAIGLALRSRAELAGFDLDEGSSLLTLRSGLGAAVRVLGWITVPWPLTTTMSLYAPPPPASAWIGAGATLLLVGWMLRRGGRRTAWLLLAALVLYAPAAFGIRWYNTVGERYLYLPLFGVAAALGALVPAAGRLGAGLLGAGTAAALALLHVRVPEWANEETLFRAAVARAPDSYNWNLLGVELLRQERRAEAGLAFETALSIQPTTRRACHNLVQSSGVVLPTPIFLERLAVWEAKGCPSADGFVQNVAARLAERQQWAAAAQWLARAPAPDPSLRDRIVAGALAVLDGDLAAAGALAVAWPGGQGKYAEQVQTLLGGRYYTDAPDAPGEPAAPVATDAPAAP